LSGAIPIDLDIARDHHLALFPPIASQDAPGYETGYRGDGIFQQSALIADIAGFYRAFGLRAGGREMERPDHITVELEFMAVLARKEALALRHGSAENVSVCRDAAATFLRDHLGCWAPAFGRRARAVTASPWLGGIGEMLALWVEQDMEAMGVVPVEIVEGPLPQEPPDDGLCGPCPAPVEIGS
jgi:TorA maturation chaperone TorD